MSGLLIKHSAGKKLNGLLLHFNQLQDLVMFECYFIHLCMYIFLHVCVYLCVSMHMDTYTCLLSVEARIWYHITQSLTLSQVFPSFLCGCWDLLLGKLGSHGKWKTNYVIVHPLSLSFILGSHSDATDIKWLHAYVHPARQHSWHQKMVFRFTVCIWLRRIENMERIFFFWKMVIRGDETTFEKE